MIYLYEYNKQNNTCQETRNRSPNRRQVPPLLCRLLDSYVERGERGFQSENQYRSSTIFIDPISDSRVSSLGSGEFVHDFKSLVHDFKLKGEGSAALAKRLEILENSLEGLLKRELLVSHLSGNKEEWSSYYETLNQKEKEIIRFESDQYISKQLIAQYERMIEELKGEIGLLTLSLGKSQQVLQENKIYRDLFESVNQIFKSNRNRVAELQKAVD